MTFDMFGVHLIPPRDRAAQFDAFVARARTDYDIILTIPMSEEYGPLSLMQVRETFPDKIIVIISNINFNGLQPDLTYIGGLSQRLPGPLSDYHSQLALFGFLQNRTVSETADLFRDETYEKIGYYDAFDLSLAELRRRDLQTDVPVTQILPQLLTQDICFFSFNHPTSVVFVHYAGLITDYLVGRQIATSSGLPREPSLVPNYLAQSVIVPVYPEIARRHGLKTGGSYTFKSNDKPFEMIGLDEMIAREFLIFENTGQPLRMNQKAKEVLTRFSALQ